MSVNQRFIYNYFFYLFFVEQIETGTTLQWFYIQKVESNSSLAAKSKIRTKKENTLYTQARHEDHPHVRIYSFFFINSYTGYKFLVSI